MLIAFSKRTSRILPRLLCRPPRHCAPILQVSNHYYIMLQFGRRGNISIISLTSQALNILRQYGWEFINIKSDPPDDLMQRAQHVNSCVELCKCSLNMYNSLIQTPRALYKNLKRQKAL